MTRQDKRAPMESQDAGVEPRQDVKAPKDKAKMAILELIDRLENIIAQGSRLPLVGKVVVSMDEVLAVLDELRLAVPEEVKEARRVLKERDHLLAEAQNEASKLMVDSQEALDARIRQTDMVKLAEERSREVLKKAQAEAQALLQEGERHVQSAKTGADLYASEVLYKLDAQLTGFLNAVRKGIEVLEREDSRGGHGN